MPNSKPLTTNQKDARKKLQLKQMEWEQNKKLIKTAKAKPKAKTVRA